MIDNFKRKLFIKFELKKKVLKGLIKNDLTPFAYRYYALYNKSKFIRFSTIGQQRNRCVLTGRAHSVVKKAHYSRFVFRTESYNGNIPGCRRAS
jgi:small subunit ribosomal protein S14